ncbi:M23 family metallopeptidase [Haloarchaeobius sp. DYHT-AS-18]|uniref:M23 family metallopeptidase n=1 Tax=Haloarchaeobius sp. DYHT-AS-18 TaxID=3446117 RepID=UPI003EBC1B42
MTEKTPASTGQSGRPAPVEALQSVPHRVVEWLAGRNMFVVMGGFFLLGFVARRIGPLAPHDWVFFLIGGILPIPLATVSTEADGYEHEISNADRLKFLVSQLRWGFTPWGILTQVLQIGGTALAYVRYLGRLPSRTRYTPSTRLTVPFSGEWTTVNGGITKPTSHSWGIVSQRYAYDFVVTDENGDTYDGDGDELTDYHAFGQPIRAPADGTVVKTKASLRDYPKPGSGWLEWRTWDIAGNHVVIEHESGEYSLVAHLKHESVRVDPGDAVTRGQVVGECGNSGFSSEPHLHFQLQDSANFWFAAGLVPRFVGTAVNRDDDRRVEHAVYEQLEDDRDELYLWAGDTVAPADD